MGDVKGSPPPRGQARRERARATRRRILAAAYTLFCAHGYAATTMDAVAVEAGVAVQTVYFTFHTKAELLKEVVHVTAAGEDDPLPVLERAWVKEADAAPDGRRLLALVVDHGSDIYHRLAPLNAAVEGAATLDLEMAAFRQATRTGRRGGMRHWAEMLRAKGQLRPDLTLERATDILMVLQGPETFLAFTAGCGWSIAEWKAWQYATLCQQLLAAPMHPM